MATRIVQFTTDTALKLFTHYSSGEIPLDATVVNIQVSARLPRWVAFIVESKDWTNTPYEVGDGYGGQTPYFLRYEGKRTMKLAHIQDPVKWTEPDGVESPIRTD